MIFSHTQSKSRQTYTVKEWMRERRWGEEGLADVEVVHGERQTLWKRMKFN
jgi:hypothetical protein